MNRFILIIIFISLLTSCVFTDENKPANNQTVGNLLIADLNTRYDSLKEFFPEYILSHFPRILDTTTLHINENITGTLDIMRLEVICVLKPSEIKAIESKYQKESIDNYSAGDTCLLIPARQITSESIMSTISKEENILAIKKNSRKCAQMKFPIPNFWNSLFKADLSNIKLSDDFTIYILDSDNVNIIGSNKYNELSNMPDNWKNGYSRGVAISNKESVIIYWAIIW